MPDIGATPDVGIDPLLDIHDEGNKMKIKFLGSGSAFVLAEENYQSNILISKDVENYEIRPESQFGGNTILEDKRETKHLLYDAGSTIAEALNAYDLKPQDLDSIYISHLHDDHAGGVEYIAFKTYFEVFNFGKTQFGSMKPKLIGHTDILREGWDTCWKGGLQSIQGQTNSLETYFDTNYMANNGTFDFYGAEMLPIQTVHVVDDRRMVPSYGLMFIENNTKVFITGDTQFAPNQMLTYYNQSDIIFQDCEFAKYPNSVHAQFHQLCDLDSDIKKKMWLYHYKLQPMQPWEEVEQDVIAMGFAGLVKRGQEFNI